MVYVISDLHGCYEEFMEMLELIEFKESDELYIIGDIVDRGPEPIKIFKYIMDKQNIHMILGNHEKMMYDSLYKKNFFDYSLWMRNGGKITDVQFKKLKESEQNKILNYIGKLQYYKEIQVEGRTYILVHGGPTYRFKEDIDEENVSEDVVWERFEVLTKEEVYPGKIIVVGHTPTMLYGEDKIINFADKRLIDCGCVFGEKLGCLRLDDEKEFYVKSKQPK